MELLDSFITVFNTKTQTQTRIPANAFFTIAISAKN